MTDRAARADDLAARSEELFRERHEANLRTTDRLFAVLMAGQWLFGALIALGLSP